MRTSLIGRQCCSPQLALRRSWRDAASRPTRWTIFPTPPWATRALFRHVLPSLGIERIESAWEPACAEGLMAEVIAESASGQVIASDIFNYGFGQAPHDFLHDEPLAWPEWVITNPPFNSAAEFTLRGLELASGGVATLVRTQWIEGIGRYEKLFRDRPPTLYAPFVERVPMVKGRWDPAASTATSYAWFIWQNGASGSTRVLWIPPGRRRELARPDDVARFAAWSLAPSDAPLLEDTAELTRLEDTALPSDAGRP
jgi:hypothetical protein